MSRAGKGPGRVRIIAGRWRGRRLDVADSPGLRPTPDRLRETLFNWLAPALPGSRCLDLYAGSGALGFEAASRGAAQVVMVEHDAAGARRLSATARQLAADAVQVVRADVIDWLGGAAQPFDIVFLDPPYAGDLLARSLALLAAGEHLAASALVYLEQDANTARPVLPAGWISHRESRAGQARGLLARIRHGS